MLALRSQRTLPVTLPDDQLITVPLTLLTSYLMLLLAVCVLVASLLSWILASAVRNYALSSGELMDVPSSRSSHSMPTPRGGGVAIVISFLVVTSGFAAMRGLDSSFALALASTGLLVAVLGFVDDRRPLPARWRFLAHAIAAVVALWCMNGIPPVQLLGRSIDLGWFGPPLACVYLIWLINLYNFMDGIDGLASIEGITVSLGGAVCWWIATDTALWPVPVILAASVGGFLVLNFPPARIFMGDAGSGFIGGTLGVLSLWSTQQAAQLFWCWCILLGCFMVDATTTLVRRIAFGERFYDAHRNHAYQYASRLYSSHKLITASVGTINLLWLLPWAVAVALGKMDGFAATLAAYIPLVWLAFRYKAGDRAAQTV